MEMNFILIMIAYIASATGNNSASAGIKNPHQRINIVTASDTAQIIKFKDRPKS